MVLRAAIAEAAAQSVPVFALGARAGAAEAATEFDRLLSAITGVAVGADPVPVDPVPVDLALVDNPTIDPVVVDVRGPEAQLVPAAADRWTR